MSYFFLPNSYATTFFVFLAITPSLYSSINFLSYTLLGTLFSFIYCISRSTQKSIGKHGGLVRFAKTLPKVKKVTRNAWISFPISGVAYLQCSGALEGATG
jgi:hypothetical protein